MHHLPLRFAPFFVLTFIATTASADLAYSNLGSADAFDSDASWTITGASNLAGRQSMAQRFVSATSGELSTIEFAVSYFEGSGALSAILYADDSSGVGPALEAFTLDLSSGSERGNLFSVSSAGGVGLTAGRGYWLGLIGQGDSWLGWNLASPALSGRIITDFDTASPIVGDDSLGALRVTTQPVPEPASMATLTLGLLLTAHRRRMGSR